MNDTSQNKPSAAADEAAINQELLLNHEYDGIREYDNPMPKWWVWIFWGSFYFALGYFVHYHLTGNGESVAQAYDAEETAAREKEAMAVMGSEVTEESLARLMTDEKMMTDAAKLFGQRCGPCHGQKGEGLIGPNLTDEVWIHGQPQLMNIHEVVSEGLQTKGMPPWKRQLSPIELGKVTAFVGSIVGTNVPGKAPEGNPITARPGQVAVAPSGSPATAASATATTAAPSSTTPSPTTAATATAPTAPANAAPAATAH